MGRKKHAFLLFFAHVNYYISNFQNTLNDGPSSFGLQHWFIFWPFFGGIVVYNCPQNVIFFHKTSVRGSEICKWFMVPTRLSCSIVLMRPWSRPIWPDRSTFWFRGIIHKPCGWNNRHFWHPPPPCGQWTNVVFWPTPKKTMWSFEDPPPMIAIFIYFFFKFFAQFHTYDVVTNFNKRL